MTSFCTIFGILPIAVGVGAGAESRRPLGIAVVGGVFFSTFLTLVVVPTVYLLLARFTGARREAPAEASAPTQSGGKRLAGAHGVSMRER
jgi:HAE1 family hydrophobic/amphiphilic exporter-1